MSLLNFICGVLSVVCVILFIALIIKCKLAALTIQFLIEEKETLEKELSELKWDCENSDPNSDSDEDDLFPHFVGNNDKNNNI